MLATAKSANKLETAGGTSEASPIKLPKRRGASVPILSEEQTLERLKAFLKVATRAEGAHINHLMGIKVLSLDPARGPLVGESNGAALYLDSSALEKLTVFEIAQSSRYRSIQFRSAQESVHINQILNGKLFVSGDRGASEVPNGGYFRLPVEDRRQTLIILLLPKDFTELRTMTYFQQLSGSLKKE